MKLRSIFFISIFAALLFSCKQRPFAKIEVMGRAVDSLGAPKYGTVDLWTGAPPGESGSTEFESAAIKPDGSFDIKTRAGWNSSTYYLLIRTAPTRTIRFSVGNNESIDLGDIAVY
jgi:hypothetical protein